MLSMHLIRTSTLALAAWLLSTAIATAQSKDEPRPAGDDLAQRTQKLIDSFIGAMPRSPADLRKAELRKQVAAKVLPTLREIRAFVAQNPQCSIADRVHEFTVYALVLGEPGLREGLTASSRTGNVGASLLLGAADAIVAGDAEHRATAVAALAKDLSRKPEDGAATAREASCAVFCLAVAGELSEAEATQLAEQAADADVKKHLRTVAETAARDPRRLLDQPFEIEGKLLDGSSLSTHSLRGKVVVIDFWATWCGPCVRALPDLVALRKAHGTEDLAIVGVDCDKDLAKVRTFLAAHPEVDWPHLFAEGEWHPIATANGIDSIPRVFVIDRKGILRSVDAGKDLEEIVRRYVAP